MERKQKPITEFELQVLRLYEELRNPEMGITPSNKEIARRLEVSRNAVARARRRLGHKLNKKGGW